MSNQKRIDHDLPSPETLAGVYVCMEAEEEVLVEPRKNQRPQDPARRTNEDRLPESEKQSEKGSGVE